MSEEPKLTCPVCGGESLSEGILTAHASIVGQWPVDFQDLDKPKPTVRRETLLARRCEQCGNVQLFMGKTSSVRRRKTVS